MTQLEGLGELTRVGIVNSVTSQQSDLKLTIQGEVPPYVLGRLLRVGPGVFSFNGSPDRIHHFLDGLAVIFKIEFTQNNAPSLSLKFLKSHQNNECFETKQFPYQIFTRPGSHWFKNFKQKLNWIFKSNLIEGIGYENSNINIVNFQGRYAALGESNKLIEFDPSTLETLGTIKSSSYARPFVLIPHPVKMNSDQNVYGFSFPRGYRFLKYISVEQTQVIGRFSPKYDFYLHSIGISDHYLIAPEGPLKLNAPRLFLPYTSLVDAIQMIDDSIGYHLCDKNTGKIQFIQAPGVNALHMVNCYEEEGTLVIDQIDYESSQAIYENLNLEPKDSGDLGYKEFYFKNSLVRRIIDLATMSVTSRSVLASDIEFPAINPAFMGKKYQYSYCMAFVYGNDPGICLKKIDFSSGTISVFSEKDELMGEPNFVQDPTSRDEDAGVLISFSKNAVTLKSSLFIICARTMKKLAQLELPVQLPYPTGLHGIWDPQTQHSDLSQTKSDT